MALMMFRGNKLKGELIRETKVEVGMRKLKNGKFVGKEFTGEMIKGGSAIALD